MKRSERTILATPAARRLARRQGIDLDRVAPGGALGQIRREDVLQAAQAHPHQEEPEAREAVKVTPAARRLADQHRVPLSYLESLGRRVFKDDIIDYLKDKGRLFTGEDRMVRLPAIRRITARRMTESHQQVPTVTLHGRADVTGLLRHRARRKQRGSQVSINDYVIRACARMLAEMPEANAFYHSEDSILLKGGVHVGVAVAVDSGLLVPVIRHADRLPLEEVARTMKDLARRARAGSLTPDEYEGGTFTISNLGMYGVLDFDPILNQPQSLILGVGAVEQALVLEEGKAKARDRMALSLTFDHRVHDGAQAAAYLQRITAYLEKFNDK